jgi:hypothetical protein
MDKTLAVSVFVLIRSELSLVARLNELLQIVAQTSTPIDRKVPRDPFSAIPVRQELDSPLRQVRACFESADYARLSRCLKDAVELLDRFEIQSIES